MAFCKNCGKELPENGVCDCQANETANAAEVKEEIKEVVNDAPKALGNQGEHVLGVGYYFNF